MFLPIEAPSEADARAFEEHNSRLIQQLVLIAAAIMLFFTVAWWPLDTLVLPETRLRAGFQVLRLRGVAVALTALVSFALLPPVGPGRQWLAVGFYAAFMAAMCTSLGAVGGLDLGWFGDAMIGLVPLAFLPMTLRDRVPATALTGAVMAFGYFGLYPGNLLVPGAHGQLSFLVFACTFSVLIGEFWQRVTRRSFFERRALDAAHAELAALTDSLAEQVADRTRSLRELAHHLDDLQEAERRRLAHDLHDDLGQQLTAMRYTLARLEHAASQGADQGLFREDLHALLEGASRSMRAVVTRLRPRILDDLGLRAALGWLCEETESRSGVPCVFECAAEFEQHGGALTAAHELALFRAAQEALTNALKHAHPSALRVSLRADAAGAVVEVVDDGVGFDPAVGSPGFGLLGLRERSRAAGGEVEVDSGPGRGCAVKVWLPLAVDAAAREVA